MKVFKINDKTLTVGIDEFTDEDISCFGNEYLDYQIAVMQWYRDGGEIEYTDVDSDVWEEITPSWDWWRSTYRAVPQTNPKEYRQSYQVDANWLGKKLIHKSGETRYITYIDDRFLIVSCRSSHSISLESMFLDYTWEDGSSCGEEI